MDSFVQCDKCSAWYSSGNSHAHAKTCTQTPQSITTVQSILTSSLPSQPTKKTSSGAPPCQHVKPETVRPPSSSAFVHKEECTLCFQSWNDADGVYVCTSCYNGGCKQHALLHCKKRNHPIAVRITRTPKPQDPSKPTNELTRLAIGLPGGAAIDSEENYDISDQVHCFSCSQDLAAGNDQIKSTVNSIISSTSASTKADAAAWEQEIIQCEHTITLKQTENAPVLKTKGMSSCVDCDLNTNLWLCMTCGRLGCGRKNYDGSGGNNHGVDHSKATGHMVVCKMGTITPEGKADIHCYACDEERLDPFLIDHLKTFGIDVSTQEKTEKSTSELAMELNKNWDFASVIEDGKKLKPLAGPGLTGLRNLGNTCYMASNLQFLFSLPEFQQRYYSTAEHHRQQCTKAPDQCFHCQMAKLADGLLSGKYAVTNQKNEQKEENIAEQDGIPPRMFKSLVCSNHPDFSTNAQQDANEFLQFMLKTIQQKERTSKEGDPSTTFNYELEQRLECTKCKKVRYSIVKESELVLPIPFQPAPKVEGEDTKDRVKKEMDIHVPFEKCLTAGSEAFIEDFACPSCQDKTVAKTTFRFKTFPDTLAVNMRRFVFDDWVPRKLAVQLDLPAKHELDLEAFRATGKQPDEQELPGAGETPQKPQINQEIVAMLMGMGFSKNACERAALQTGNSDANAASMWLMEHMEDADINDPIEAPPASDPMDSDISPEAVANLEMMGFSKNKCRRALMETSGDPERAIEWLFSHADEPDEAFAAPPKQSLSDGKGSYDLVGFIVHMGTSVHSGHYVAFVKKQGKWVIFNDRKVGESMQPAIGAGYVYFFRRKDAVALK